MLFCSGDLIYSQLIYSVMAKNLYFYYMHLFYNLINIVNIKIQSLNFFSKAT